MIHTKPHKHLPTSAQEPHSNTNTEPKHIVESLSSSLWPDPPPPPPLPPHPPSPAARFSLQVKHPASDWYSSLLISSPLQSWFEPAQKQSNDSDRVTAIVYILKSKKQMRWVQLSVGMQVTEPMLSFECSKKTYQSFARACMSVHAPISDL